jgi:phosphate transport system substrate-binding protein
MKLSASVLALLALSTVAASAQNLNASGASAPYPLYSRWFTEYGQAHPGVKINYQSIGSGGGIKQVSDGITDFGASDAVMTPEQIAAAKVKVVAIPTVLVAAVPVYNVPGVKQDLKFSQDAIAGIYLGKITKWNDPYIAKENPGVSLPDQTILPVFRSDSSGTTFIFTDWLSKVSPEWKERVGNASSVKWPVGIGQKGSEGVAGMVRQLPYSFGYVELVYAEANHMQVGLVRNKEGHFIKASTTTVTAAAAAFANKIPADYRVSITDAPGADSYPISSFTWLLIPTTPKSAENEPVIKGFLEWMLNTGEGEAASLTYAPLPPALIERLHKTVASLK